MEKTLEPKQQPYPICTITTKRKEVWILARTMPAHITHNYIYDQGLRKVCKDLNIEYPISK